MLDAIIIIELILTKCNIFYTKNSLAVTRRKSGD